MHRPFHVILFALYPVLFVYSQNKTEIQGWMIIRPLLVNLVVLGIIYLLARIVIGSPIKAAFFCFVFLVVYSSYGQVYHLQETAPAWIEPLIRHRFLILVSIVILGITIGYLTRHSVESFTLPLNTIALVLFLIPLVDILGYVSRKAVSQFSILDQKSSDVQSLTINASSNQPDIYYIILDTYTRGDVLLNRFGYDNSGFYRELEKEGAYVASCSRSNYAQTLLSLSSSLNMSFIHNLSPHPNDILDLTNSLNSNIVYKTLRENGYQLITFDTGFSPGTIVNADFYKSAKQARWINRLLEGFQSFEAMFYDSTAFKIVLDQQASLPPAIRSIIQSPYSSVRESIFYQLDQADKQLIPGPKIVHLHLLAPHPPATFDANGQPVDGQKYFTLNPNLTQKREFGRKAYVDEVKYLNQRILEILRSIKASSTRPFVLIVQGDHGTFGFGTGDENDRTKILNVYYFSDGNYSLLYPGISPINTFRIVFNQYFGSNLPLLPDKTYFSGYDASFDFNELAENYPPCMN